MPSYGLTKARSMGPVVQFLRQSGGSVDRVFRRAELPLRLVEEPERLTTGATAAVIFPADLPDSHDVVACVERLMGLALLEKRPSVDWICRRLGVAPRTLQRQLAVRATRFDHILRRALQERACELLRSGASVTETAFELGYSDPAHFSRAFRRWTGMTPREMHGRSRRAPGQVVA